LKVLCVNPFALPDSVGGTQLLLAALTQSLRQRGHEPALFRMSADPAAEPYTTARGHHAGADTISVRTDFATEEGFRCIYRNEKADAVFERTLLEESPDVVHIHHLTCLSTGILQVTRKHRVPTVLTLWDFWMSCPRGQRLQADLTLCTKIDRATCARCCAQLWPNLFANELDRDLQTLAEYDAWIREQIEQVDILVTPSASTRQEYLDWGIRRDEVHVVEPGLNLERFAQLAGQRKPRDFSRQRLRVAYIGTVIPSKGAHVAIEAIQQLDPERFSLDVHGEICAWHEDRDYESRLRALDRKTHAIRFHGRYDNTDVPRILAEADALVVPGLWHETYCLTIREGFLAGVPVIASDLGAMAEGIRDGETGLLVEPGNAARLAAAIERLRDEPALYQRLAHSKKPVVPNEAMVDQLVSLYGAAIEKVASRRGSAEPEDPVAD